jgi:ABC-type nitrate/sulfonate/bicarbonate transport system substrate-binding protein
VSRGRAVPVNQRKGRGSSWPSPERNNAVHNLTNILRATITMAVAGVLLTAAARAADDVTIGVDFNVIGAQAWIAQDKGFFRKHGVEPSIRPFAFGIDTVDAVLAGRLDFGMAIDFALTARLRSGQLRMISAIIEPDPGFHKLVVKASIQKPEDLAGKRMGLAKGTSQHLVTLSYLRNFGINPDAAILIPMPSLTEIVASLRADRIDAAFVWGEAVARAVEIPGVRILSDDAPANVLMYGYLVTSEKFSARRPQAVKNVLTALIDATEWMRANFEEAVDIVASHAKSPRERVKAEMLIENYTISLKPKQLESFDKVADFAAINGLTPSRVSPREFVDSSHLKAVAPGLVTLHD